MHEATEGDLFTARGMPIWSFDVIFWPFLEHLIPCEDCKGQMHQKGGSCTSRGSKEYIKHDLVVI